MIVVIDNYDSFTYNLVHYLQMQGAEVTVLRNDVADPDTVAALAPQRLLISPGPGTPADAGHSLALIHAFAGRLPILGVCLGHQCLAAAFGGEIVRAPRVMHGKTSALRHDATGLFAGLPQPLTVTRYHSLVVAPTLPAALTATAWTDDGCGGELIMGLQHRQWPLYGVQFHPEAVLTEGGQRLLSNFLAAD